MTVSWSRTHKMPVSMRHMLSTTGCCSLGEHTNASERRMKIARDDTDIDSTRHRCKGADRRVGVQWVMSYFASGEVSVARELDGRSTSTVGKDDLEVTADTQVRMLRGSTGRRVRWNAHNMKTGKTSALALCRSHCCSQTHSPQTGWLGENGDGISRRLYIYRRSVGCLPTQV